MEERKKEKTNKQTKKGIPKEEGKKKKKRNLYVFEFHFFILVLSYRHFAIVTTISPSLYMKRLEQIVAL